MKDLDPIVFMAVFQEMLGFLFWPLVAFIVIGAVALLAVIIRDRRIHPQRLVLSELIGLAGGFVAIALMLWVTESEARDLLGGPIDWLLTVAIWIAGAIGATIAAYVGLSLIAGGPSDAHERV